jgi:hypothetical protein
MMGVTDPLRTQLERYPIDVLGEDPTANPAIGLEHEWLMSGIEHFAGRAEPRQTCADDDHICFACHADPQP